MLPLKIAIVSEFSISSYPGGGEKRYYEMGKRLAALGHAVTWICMAGPEGGQGKDLDGINVLHLGTPVQKPPFRSALNFLSFNSSLIKHLRTRRYDVVDAQSYSPMLGAYLGTVFSATKLIATIHDATSRGHSHEDFFQYRWLANILEPMLYRLPFKQIVTVSHVSANTLVERYGVKRDRVCVIHNGVSLEDIDKVPDQPKRYDYIFVGRLVPSKHLEDFVALCVRTKRTGAIVGDGPLRDEVQKMCLKHKAVTFLGCKDSSAEVIAAMKQAKVLVLPSTREGFGLVLAEAGAAGLPVIAYESGGVVEVVDHGKNGFLVPPRDMATLCKLAKKALCEPLCSDLGKAGRLKVERRFTWKRATAELEHIYTTRGELVAGDIGE